LEENQWVLDQGSQNIMQEALSDNILRQGTE